MAFNYKQLTFVREYLGYSQTELASKIPGLSQSNLSKFEKGVGVLSSDVIQRIIEFLGFPEEFYNLKIFNNVENAHYRRKASLTKKERCHIEYSNKLIGYLADEMAESVVFPNFSLTTINIEDGYTPEYVAQYTRKFMHLGESEPVMNICELLERYGIIIVENDYDQDSFDGVSFITDKGSVVIVINRNFSNDRKRLTLAHELGHVIMHLQFPVPEYRDKEEEAFRFASEFLMPESEIRPSLEGLKLNYLAPLKNHWLTSMASIIKKAYDLGCITKDKYRYFNIELSRRGYKKHEPIEVGLDKPTVFYDAYDLFKKELSYTTEDFERAFKLPGQLIKEFCERSTYPYRIRIIKKPTA